MIDGDEVLVVVEGGISEIVLSSIYFQIFFKDTHNLGKNRYLFVVVSKSENFPNCLLVVEIPTIQAKEYYDIQVEDVMIYLKFSKN